ncbi:hypothetical protein ACLKA7_006535 [Drosophila subpalustris]
MEKPMQCREPTRAVILAQLKSRELYVANAEKLPLEQLLEIYNGFIVPHPRRERRERQRPVANVEVPMEMPLEMPMQVEELTKRIKVVHMVVGEKRPASVEQQFSSCAPPKRLKCQE